jgi:hypothetical protein
VCSALATIEAWTSDLSAHVRLEDRADLRRAHTTKVWPYTLRNDTGQPIRFWAGRALVAARDASVHTVAAGDAQVFAFATLPSTAATAATAATARGTPQMELHCITIECRRPDAQAATIKDAQTAAIEAPEASSEGGGGSHSGTEVVANVLVDGEGVHMFALPSGQCIVVEISSGPRGSKVVSLQSVVKV